MRRWTETIEVLDFRRAHREIVIDFTLPEEGGTAGDWMMPTAFLDKTPVAPDLEVLDSAGNAVSVPTKRENMAITIAALEKLAAAGAVNLGAFPELSDLAQQVVSDEPFEARIARFLAEAGMDEGDQLLRSLLRSLEDHFLLWVPVSGQPGCDQQIRVLRRLRFGRDRLMPRERIPEQRQVDTPLGAMNVEFQASGGRRRLKPSVAISRAQLFFGLAPIEYRQEVTEARRFASFHLRVLAPDGLLVRGIGLEVPKVGTEDHSEPEMEEVESEPGRLFQGTDSDMGHLHCSRPDNPSSLVSLTTFGIRDGLTTLWASVAVLTTMLLWSVHRLAPSDPADFGDGQLESTVAILLVGPLVAAAWAIRSDSDLVERSLQGARALLLISAALALAAALSLAGLRPFQWENDLAVEVYASVSYFVAAAIVVGWVVTLPPTWFAYREVLTNARRNLAAVALVSLAGVASVAHSGPPTRVTGFILLLSGLVLGAIAVHPGRSSSTDDRGSGPVVAGVGSLGMLLGAGYFLGFYDNVLAVSPLRWGVGVYEAAVVAVALELRRRLP